MTALQPITVVELRQPRCGLRFGTYPCVAALATGTTRTNLCLYSEAMDNAAWAKTRTVVVADQGDNPDGEQTADLLREDTATNTHFASQTVAGLTVGQVVTVSVFVEIASGTRQITLRGDSVAFGALQIVRFSGSTGAVVASSGGASGLSEDIGSGIWRISMTTVAAVATSSEIRIYLSDGSGNTPSYTGDGASGYYIWGVQVEVGSGASTYKPTTSAAVSALWGTAERYCHNTWSTCPSSATKLKMNLDGRIRWRFMQPVGGVRFDGDFTDENDIATPAIPVAKLSVRTSPASLNIAALTEGKSPFGVTGTVTVSMSDFVWDDTWGDYYKADRGTLPTRTFWATWLARNRLPPQMELVVYEGYVGDALSAMRQRVYLVDGIDGPSDGMITIKGSDPLRKARGKTALFPPADAAKLYGSITAATTSITIAATEEAFVSTVHGLTARRAIRIGNEIIEYTGYSALGSGLYSLSGVLRASGGTTAATATEGAKVTRCGHFEFVVLADVAKYLLTDYTPIPDAYIDTVGWADETATWLSIGRVENVWIPEATAVETLLGELCQQGQFIVFWDEWDSLIKMRAVAPPTDTVVHLTDDNAILADSATVAAEHDARLTRIVVYYDPLSWVDISKAGCRSFSLEVHGDEEQEKAGGEPRQREVIARWVSTEAQAGKIIGRTFLRSLTSPRILTMTLDAKDGDAVKACEVIDVSTRAIVDVDGNKVQTRFQVISSSPGKPGQTYEVECQDYGLSSLRYCRMMDSSATADYASATATEIATGGYMAAADGTMSDGSDGYRIA
jgi:hypothetical protein